MDPVKISSSPSPETENDRCETGNSSPKAPGAHTSSQDQPNTFEVPPETFRRYIPVTIDASQIADPDPKKTAHVSSPSTGTGESDYIYNVKWISFRGSQCPVVTQNENGPCPIIAIANVLSLRRIFTLSEKTELLTGQRLVSLLSDILLSQPPPSSDDGLLLNYESTVSDAFNLFPSLQTGLDINVRFNGVGAFEFTPALGVFDLFKIPLYHGWVVDPEEKDLVAVVGDRTYNQLVEQVIDLKASTDPEKVTQGLLAEEFLAQTASQLTYHGLCELASTISDGHLAVLFRNNHYNAIFKHEGRIYVLVTDMGLLHEPNVVWEVLNDVDGDTQFVDSSFHLYVPSSQTLNSSSANPPVAAESKLPESAHSQSNIASLHDLERVCSEHLKLPSSSSEHGGTDMDLAARLQLAEIESSKQATKPESGSKVIPVPASAVNEKKCVSTDKLSHVCSEELLAQAQRELGTGSDLDVAVQLQWEEMNQTPDQSPASTRRPVSSTTSSSTRRGSHRRNSTSERDRGNCILL